MDNLPVDWTTLNKLSGTELKHATFKAIQEASYFVQSASVDEPHLLEAVPRLAELIDLHSDELGSFRSLLSSLARSTGLWNYIDTDYADIDDAFVAEAVTARANYRAELIARRSKFDLERAHQFWQKPLG